MSGSWSIQLPALQLLIMSIAASLSLSLSLSKRVIQTRKSTLIRSLSRLQLPPWLSHAVSNIGAEPRGCGLTETGTGRQGACRVGEEGETLAVLAALQAASLTPIMAAASILHFFCILLVQNKCLTWITGLICLLFRTLTQIIFQFKFTIVSAISRHDDMGLYSSFSNLCFDTFRIRLSHF